MAATTQYMTEQSTHPAYRIATMRSLWWLQWWHVYVFRKMCVAEVVFFFFLLILISSSAQLWDFIVLGHHCCISILYIALSLLVQPSPWLHTKANTKQISAHVCVRMCILFFLCVCKDTSLSCFLALAQFITVPLRRHVSVLVMNFTWRTFHAPTRRSPWVDGSSQRAQWEFFAWFWSHLHTL